jgi:hypothetical protein
MRLFHGTIQKFDKPDIVKCREAGREFGRGMYLTSNIKLAEEYAKMNMLQFGSKEGLVYEYEFENQKCCELEYFSKCDNWKKVVDNYYLKEREYENYMDIADVISGPLKDNVLKNKSLDEQNQICLKSKEAVSQLTCIKVIQYKLVNDKMVQEYQD